MGDTHIPIDIKKLSNKNFLEQKNLTKSDYVIICGDFGGVWDQSNEEKYWIKWLDNKSFTTLFVDGNHENFTLLNNYDVEFWNGGKIHKITDSIYHLMRGQIFTIDGLKFFTMGGAASHDKVYRKENKSWWPQEIPSYNELREAVKNLSKNNWKVDYIITHCAPNSIQYFLADWYKCDTITNFFELIRFNCKYKKWYFGHYHKDLVVDNKHIGLYNKIIKIK